MAKVKFFGAVDPFSLQFAFMGTGMYGVNSKGTVATYSDFGGGVIQLRGKNFETDIIGFSLTGGSIKEAKFLVMGENFMKVEGSYSVATFNKAVGSGSFEGIAAKFLAKDDKITGSKDGDGYLSGFGGDDTIKGLAGADTLNGGKGKDTLAGGGGADIFQFAPGYGKDKITDFDAHGGPGAQDLIYVMNGEYEVVENAKGDAVVKLSNKDTLTLVGVSVEDIDASDFYVV